MGRIKIDQSSDRLLSLMVARYEDLTATEMAGNIAWFRLSRANQFHEGFRALQVALDLEHFIAVLPLDPADPTMTDGMIEELKSLRSQTAAITGENVKLNFLGETIGEGGQFDFSTIVIPPQL